MNSKGFRRMDFGPSHDILGVWVNPMTKALAVDRVSALIDGGAGGYICFAEAHMVMEAQRCTEFREIVNGARLTTTDGTPLRWIARLSGFRNIDTVDGPGMVPLVLQLCAQNGYRVGFYGSREETLEVMTARLRAEYPNLLVAFAYSPPFRPLNDDESSEIMKKIRESEVQVLFVSLGCPKQERWMAQHQSDIPCLMLGVGAVFDFLAGRRKMPPAIVQRMGLTWLYRTFHEPRRLAKRTFRDLPLFLIRSSMQIVLRKMRPPLTSRKQNGGGFA